ncbi:Zn-dependent M28 family amino/carboxypeptidase [Roseivirga pacifica]|uniref:Zn-dependent amino-or carboxypeptidase, M28 family n=1 Tax=Roseivirga pacifica TaxID=1267423 RepID=A0A1I0NTZ9_9BACT|nr:M28 family peptidase [Roseivirga pacifica]RKQ51465.1 Zn-dependent M28 family amino/carboxypeptidase [Roseivirga pacifica]SEW05205.1 Zn-dependent amino-or carboxypeptidase, M28 family [Roseivirga pacifica]
MRRLLSFVGAAIMLPMGVVAQQQDASVKYANTITPQDMRSKLSILASDDFGGRETGTEGQKKASKFLEDFYKEIGLEGPVDGTYRQKFNMYQSDWSDVYIKTRKGKKLNGEEIIFLGYENMSKEAKLDAVYVGKGTNLEGLDLEGKAVIAMAGDRSLMRTLSEAGAKAVMMMAADDEQFKQTLPRQRRAFIMGRLRFEEEYSGDPSMIFYITQEIAAEIFRTSTEELTNNAETPSNIKARTVNVSVKEKLNTISTENMMAFLEGTDLKDEVLVISSHYDHIGQNEDGSVINNGADDDGSGTTGVMEIAEAFAQAAKEGHRPRRSILFLNVTGEEKGLLGSAYYSDNPIFPIENTVNNLNIDMIGRVDPEHEESGNRDYVYVIGSEKLSSHLKVISEYANITYTKLDLDYRYDDPNDRNRFYYRSDHYNFAKKGIPIIFYFNGTHADYHRPTDTVEKITFDVMAKRAQLVFHTAWLLANRNDRTPVDREDDMDYGSR